MTTASAPLQPRNGPSIAGVLPAGARLLEYEIIRVLGRPGGFGVTYLALDSNLLKDVAIKEYLPVDFAIRTSDDSISMRSEADQPAFEWGLRCFLNEARVLAKFRHPNVVQVHRLFEAQNTAYIVLEHVQGQTLGEYLGAHPDLDQRGIESFLLPLLDGLAQVHAAGVLHRDLKPENVLIRADGSPVLIDFGAARNALGSRSRSIMSVLTTGYAPIEQYSDSGAQGPWTDIYALGAVVHRAIVGRKPADAIDRIGKDPVEPLAATPRPGFAPSFLKAVDWALRVRAEDRPAEIAEWREALVGQRAVPEPAAARGPLLSAPGVDLDLDPRSRSTTRQVAPLPPEVVAEPPPFVSASPTPAAEDERTSLHRTSSALLTSPPGDERTLIYRPSEASPVDTGPNAKRTGETAAPASGSALRSTASPEPDDVSLNRQQSGSGGESPTARRHLKIAAGAMGLVALLMAVVVLWPHGAEVSETSAATTGASADGTAQRANSPLAAAVQKPADTATGDGLPPVADAPEKAMDATAVQEAPVTVAAAAEVPPTPAASGALTAAAPAPVSEAKADASLAASSGSGAGRSAGRSSGKGKAKTKPPAEAAATAPEPNTSAAPTELMAGLAGKWTVETAPREIDAGSGCRATATQEWTLAIDPDSTASGGSFDAAWHAVWIPKWGCQFFNDSAKVRGQFRVAGGAHDARAISLTPAKCSGECEKARALGFVAGGPASLRLESGDAQRLLLQIGEQSFVLQRAK